MTEPTSTTLEPEITTGEDAATLVTLEQDRAYAAFTTPGTFEPLLGRIEEAVRAIPRDITTQKGRDAVASLAYKVSKTKTTIEEVGEGIAKQLKELPKVVDANRRVIKTRLDALRDEVRKPLTEWETREAQISADLDALKEVPVPSFMGLGAEAFQRLVDNLKGVDTEDEARWGSHCAAAARAKAEGLAILEEMLAQRVAYDKEQAELAEFRRQKEEKERLEREAAEKKAQEERDEKLRLEGEERARLAAQAAAEPKADAVMGADPGMSVGGFESVRVPEPAAPSVAAPATDPQLEHKRVRNQEALADISRALVGSEPGKAGEAILRAIVRGQIRHVSITY